MKRFIFSMAVALIFILFLEVGFRIFGKESRSVEDYFRLQVCGELLGEYDDVLFWRLKDVKPDFGTESGLKIMCLTDSVAVMYEGKGYPDILQELLSRVVPEKNPIVFNGSVPGYTSFQGLKYFTTELIAYEPDVVVVNYGWNDHWQSGNRLPDKLQNPEKIKFMRNIVKHSKIVGFIISSIMKKKQAQYEYIGPEEFVRVSAEDYKNNLLKFVEICKKENILLVLMTAPYLDGPEEWIPIHKKYNSIVRQIAINENVPIIDLVEVFVDREDLFIEPESDKCHYNWKGSQIIAEALADVILRYSKLN